MGKDKSGQRTKGNLKPSSSGRSAELLGGVTSFVGFGGLNDLGYVPAATQATVDDDAQISAEFRVTLRKMSKKDAVTKVKALQEFEGLCSSEDLDSIKTALPYWPRLYSKLSLDCDRRVRESAQSAHSALANQIGKNLAPYLRTIMPSWLLAMTDPHSPAAISATKSFQSAFSEEKRPGVMIFCSKEIMDSISDNLFIQSSQTLSDPKNTAKEEQESKFLRVLFCSLKSLSLFLETTAVLAEKKGEVLAKIVPFIEHQKFWALAKHESTLVRSAWFDTIKTLFEYDVSVLRPHSERLSKIVFTSMDSPDSIVLPHVWIAFLHLCVGLPDCWSSCGNPKSVLNRIFSVLRDGGRGYIHEISPQLLPILSVIPVHILEDPIAFYVEFFRAISSSLRKEKVLSCKRDVSDIIVALNECLKYMSKEHGDNAALWDTLMQYQVVDLLCSSFESTSQLSDSHLYHEIGKLLHYWVNAVDAKGVQQNSRKVEMFWEQFSPQCEAWVEQGEKGRMENLLRFFSIVKDPFSAVAKRSKGVRFSEEKTLSHAPLPLTSTSHKDAYLKIMSSQISPLIQHCFRTFKKGRNEAVYNLFASLLFSYSPEDIYEQMTCEGGAPDPSRSRVLFLEQHILPLMQEEDAQPVVDTSIDLFMHTYARVPMEQQKQLLLNLKPTLKLGALKSLLEKMTDKSASDSIAALWLHSDALTARVVGCLQEVCTMTLAEGVSLSKHHHRRLTNLITFVFSNGYKSHTVFSLGCQSQMLKLLKEFLLEAESKARSDDAVAGRATSGEDGCLEEEIEEESSSTKFLLLLTTFLNHLLDSSIHSCVDGLTDMMKHLYHMLCYPPVSTPERVLAELRSCFLKAFELNLRETMSASCDLFKDDQSLLAYVTRETKSLVMDEACSFAKILTVCDFVESILGILFKCSPAVEDCSIFLDHSVMQPTLEKLLPSDMEWGGLESKLCPLYVTPALLSGTFICREFPLPTSTKDIPPWHQGFAKASLFLCKAILALCSPAQGESDADDGSISLGQFTPLVVLALHGACHLSTVVQMNIFLSHDSVSADIKLGSDALSSSMHQLLGMINSGNKKLIVKQLRDRCSYGDSRWCVTLGHVLSSWIKEPINATKLVEELTDDFIGCTETKQILIPYLPDRSLSQILHEETKRLSQLSEDPYSALPSVCVLTSVLEHLSSRKAREAKDTVSDQELKDAINVIFSVLVKWRDTAASIFLFASDVTGVPWEDVSLMVSIIRLLTVVVKGHSLHMVHSHWDVHLCALAAWVQSLNELSQFPETNIVVTMFASACCKCAGVVAELLSELVARPELREEYPPTLVEEWREFFAPSIFNTLLLKYIYCANVFQRNQTVVLYSLIRSLSLSVGSMESAVLKEVTLPPLFSVADSETEFKMPQNLQIFLNHLVPLMLSRHPQCQCASYSLLKMALPEVMSAWEKNDVSVNEEEDLPQRPLPHALISMIQESGPVVETALMDKEIGCTCEVLPYTDTYTYTAGYLLAWLLTLTCIPYGEESNQQLYASYIRESNLLFGLLNNLFKLMPLKPSLEQKQSSKSEATMFNTPLTVSACGKVSSTFISWLACQVYLSCLTQLPAAVRNWWTNLDRTCQQVVDKFTSTHVSPILIANEINTINDSTLKFDNMTIKSRPGAREVVAIYTIDEASMELVLRMSPNHPLSTVTLEDHKRVGVSVAQWRNWLFGLNTMLSHRNTPLLNSLEFWKKNVDQKFEGIEECFICYYVLHGTNHQIPKLLCRTCKKKFHSACLFKWFSTSNNSTCPICRSLF